LSFQTHIEINHTRIGPNCPTYIIAEMSANHGQDLGKAKELVHAAKESGSDAIKLQTYRADTLTMKCNLDHFYIQEGPWKGQYLYDLYEGAYMPWDFHAELFELAAKIDLTCFSSPFDHSAVELLSELQAPAYKIASPELIDHELIARVAATGKPVILSTGGATLHEIAEAVDFARSAGVTQICVLKCTSVYPAPPESIHLATIEHLQQAFRCPVGLSDHSLGNAVPIASVAMGAQVIEKHFVLSKQDNTADSFFSMTPAELQDLVTGVRQVEKAIGRVSYPDQPSQARRCLYAAVDIKAGERLSRDNVVNLRPGGGQLMPKDIVRVIGRKAKCDLPRGTQLRWDMLEQ
jgi:pseudaminic acid synthase